MIFFLPKYLFWARYIVLFSEKALIALLLFVKSFLKLTQKYSTMLQNTIILFSSSYFAFDPHTMFSVWDDIVDEDRRLATHHKSQLDSSGWDVRAILYRGKHHTVCWCCARVPGPKSGCLHKLRPELDHWAPEYMELGSGQVWYYLDYCYISWVFTKPFR